MSEEKLTIFDNRMESDSVALDYVKQLLDQAERKSLRALFVCYLAEKEDGSVSMPHACWAINQEQILELFY